MKLLLDKTCHERFFGFPCFKERFNGEVTGSETTINSGDLAGILMIAVQALEKRTAELKQKEARIADLESRLEALELRKNNSIQITAEKNASMQ